MSAAGVVDRQANATSRSTRLEGMTLAAIAALALAIRLAAIAYAFDHFQPELTEYQVIARNLIERGYFGIDWLNWSDPDPGPSSFMPPLYPIVLAIITTYWPQAALTVMRVIQAILSTLTCLLIYMIILEVFDGDRRTALLAAAASAVYPAFIGPVVEVNTATFEVAFLALTVYSLLLSRKRRPVRNLVAAGIMLGLAALTKATALIVLPAIFLWLWVNRRDSFPATVVAPIGILLVATLITILPWTMRNLRVHHHFVLISTNAGLNFWIGNNEKASGEFIWPGRMSPQLVEQAMSMTEVERDRFFLRKGLEFLWANPGRAIRLFGRKLLYSVAFRPSLGSNYTRSSPALTLGRIAYVVSYLLFLPFWITGLLISLRQWRNHILFYGFIAGYVAINVAFFVGTRFRTPVDPYLLMYAALTVVFLWTRLTTTRHQAPAHSSHSP